MASFDPIPALVGGGLIGLAAALMMLLNGRIAGVSGVLGGLLSPASSDKAWRAAFLAGLIVAPLIAGALGRTLPEAAMPSNWLVIAAGGLLVGFGTRYGSGCTSGHGVCGMSRLSTRSIVATVVFMATAALTVAIVRHGMAG